MDNAAEEYVLGVFCCSKICVDASGDVENMFRSLVGQIVNVVGIDESRSSVDSFNIDLRMAGLN